jgi:hypothetical protein
MLYYVLIIVTIVTIKFTTGGIIMTSENMAQEYISELLEKATKGDAHAQLEYADLCGAIKGDYKESLYWTKKAAEQGYAKAQCNLAMHYKDGAGTPVDNNQAFFWFEQAAKNGDAVAMNALGVFYQMGYVVSPDKKKALDLYEKAANLGNKDAKDNLESLKKSISTGGGCVLSSLGLIGSAVLLYVLYALLF